MSNIVHEYYKKDHDGTKILIKLDPIHFRGTELTIFKNGEKEFQELEFDAEIYDNLKEDGFEPASPLEFNLHASGLTT